MTTTAGGSGAYWFVGATHGTNDQTSRFLSAGIWENGYTDKYLDKVKSIQPGDRIAIKSTYNQKHDLPFDNRGYRVSVMDIKATGIVKKNHGDGRTLDVEWTPGDPPGKWYFFTYRGTVWRVLPGDWYADALISFTFEGKAQDIAPFRNHSYWRDRFGDTSYDKEDFLWTRFYEAIADKLLSYRDRRGELIKGIHSIASKVEGLSALQDEFKDGTKGPLRDICPFTVMGIFNRGHTDLNRKHIATELAAFLGVEEVVPDSFEGVPLLNNQRSWFFWFDKKRQPGDIDALWEMFAQAIAFADSDDAQADFIAAYDKTSDVLGVGWNLTMGLYWIRPWHFPTLDSQSQHYISKKLNIKIEHNNPKGRCTAHDYLEVLNTLKTHFHEDTYPAYSFPGLSLAAWLFKDGGTSANLNVAESDVQGDDIDSIPEEEIVVAPIEPYSVDKIISDGCFTERSELERILERLRTKKNLILQGPPGTGKTWLAKRLAFALIGQKNDSKIRAIQFHPNMSYEDFVRGWRPSGDGRLTLVDGPFLEMIRAAEQDASTNHVIVIEEINRGNPAQILGEMLTLLEADKRTPNEALELSYRREAGERVFIPANLYVIGTMNIADRSLALVDLALRRRFAFIDLKPSLKKAWKEWVHNKCGIDADILDEIENRIQSLNAEISNDPSLGEQFSIGHSYVTPRSDIQINDARKWFRQVVATEIGPLLDEYWFDAPNKAQKAKKDLRKGF